MIRRAVFYLNQKKENVLPTAKTCAALCRDFGITPVILSSDQALWESQIEASQSHTFYADAPHRGVDDALFVFGGDGTVLRAMDAYVAEGLPILGINLGRLGFLPEVQTGEMAEAIRRVADQDYHIKRRMMLFYEAHTARGVCKGYATNEVSVSRGLSQRCIAMDVKSDGALVDHYIADGVLVATPTGSTAYSLSAGGPIVSADVDCILINPICPHALTARPIILSAKSTIEVSLNMKELRVGSQLSADGVTLCELTNDDQITIRRSPYDALFIRLSSERNPFALLRSKMNPSLL